MELHELVENSIKEAKDSYREGKRKLEEKTLYENT